MDAAKKEKQQQLIVMVLFLVFVGVFIQGPGKQFFRSRSAKPATPVVATQPLTLKPLQEAVDERWDGMMAQVNPKPAALPKDVKAEKGSLRYSAHELRNPMQSWLPKPPESKLASAADKNSQAQSMVKPPAPPVLTVQGLFWGDVEPAAIVNGKFCRVGDQVEGAIITAIDRQGITAEFQGIVLHLDVASATQLRGSQARQLGR